MDYLPEISRLEHQLDLAHRSIRRITDAETVCRLQEFASEISDRLRALREACREEKIRRRAHALWEDAGRPIGRDLEFWLSAEREFLRGGNLPLRA
ncbi:DUF2934 domain-containing protein [Bradyrhizobium arachidis]|uniref:DUF2934 domain-containing protein n=1 Tax=Bradyrhizobium arachidis TaxID=858423 RepID=A0AAE7NPC7_9BRAD|nr:DUF2934 domain-containing protein [Bradyrhizobium arachidis]QOZ69147.1 DUF2934 domain-containing protein [Bradyrhizobium arachidis]